MSKNFFRKSTEANYQRGMIKESTEKKIEGKKRNEKER